MSTAAALPQDLSGFFEPPEPRQPIQRLNYNHEACVDYIIAHPEATQNEIAARFGRSPSWLSVVMRSDAFKARLAARRAEVVDPALEATVQERFEALTVRSLEVLQEKLALPSSEVPAQLALQAAALGAKSLGLGVAGAPTTVPPAADSLALLAHRLLDLQKGAPRQVIDITPRSLP